MDKEEILEKSRKENLLHDEGEMNARDKGRQWGEIGFLFLCVAVGIYNFVLGLDASLPIVFFFGYLSCDAFGRYGARRDKSRLVTGILYAIGTLAFLVAYVAGTLQGA